MLILFLSKLSTNNYSLKLKSIDYIIDFNISFVLLFCFFIKKKQDQVTVIFIIGRPNLKPNTISKPPYPAWFLLS